MGTPTLQGNLLLELEEEQGFCSTEEVLESGESRCIAVHSPLKSAFNVLIFLAPTEQLTKY